LKKFPGRFQSNPGQGATVPIELHEIAEKQVTTAKATPLFKRQLSFGSKVTSNDRRFFTEQLSLMLETGSNLYQALSMLHEQSQQPAMAKIIGELVEAVAGGRSFSAALSDHPEAFSTSYINLVAASETGGFLHEVLAELLIMEEKADELSSTVRSALAYPILLSVFSLVVVIFVLVVVFPKFSVMFAKIHDQLPASTIVLMYASDMLRGYWAQMTAALAAAVFLMVRWKNSESGKATLDRLKVTLPGIRHIFIQIYLVQSLRVISLSLSNGVNIVDTLAASRDVVDNDVMREFFSRVEEQVQQGNGVAVGFQDSELIPVLAQRMIITGEESGNMPKVMSRLADFYERELTKRLKSVSKMAEPVMIMVMGLIVGVIVSSLILPIFKLSRAVT
jgi:type II secretory pathway component PulF